MEAPKETVEKKCEVIKAINKLIRKNFKPKEGEETHDLTISLTEESFIKLFNVMNKHMTMKIAPLSNKKPAPEKEKKGNKTLHSHSNHITKSNSDLKKHHDKHKDETKPKLEKAKTE